jgi:hypothetical protein
MLEDQETTHLFAMAIAKRIASSSTRLVIPWSKSKQRFIPSRTDLNLFQIKIDNTELEIVLNSLKQCQFYITKAPRSQYLIKICLVLQFLLLVLLVMAIGCLLVFKVFSWPIAVVLFVVYLVIASVAYVVYIKSSTVSIKLKLIKREKSIKKLLNKHN